MWDSVGYSRRVEEVWSSVGDSRRVEEVWDSVGYSRDSRRSVGQCGLQQGQ